MQKKKVLSKEGVGHREGYFRSGPRDRPIARPSRRPFEKEHEYTPLNARREDILKEVYHLKLLPRPIHLKGLHIVMGKDKSAWCAYHRLRGHHTENCHQWKKEIKILIQKGRVLSYVKDVGGQPRKRSLPREDLSSENQAQKKGKNTEKVRKARITRHTLNTIVGEFLEGGETI